MIILKCLLGIVAIIGILSIVWVIGALPRFLKIELLCCVNDDIDPKIDSLDEVILYDTMNGLILLCIIGGISIVLILATVLGNQMLTPLS